MAKMTLRPAPWSGLAFVVLAVGCGGPHWTFNEHVEGTVKLNGTPVPNVLVQFIPDDERVQAPSSSGYTDDKGHFRLETQDNKPGAVIGRHNVLVFPGRAGGSGQDEAAGPQGPARVPPPIPPVYTVAAETPLQVTVTADQHDYPLTLTSGARPRANQAK